MKILIVDDHPGLREEIQGMLTRRGHMADAVGSADDALPLLATGDYDFLLVDFQMPVHDGLWLMKHRPRPTRTKALLITAHVDRSVINEMFNAGAVGYIIKPFGEEDLLRHLAFHSEHVVRAPEG